MPEGQEALESLIVRIEADLRDLLAGAEEGVEKTTEILQKIPPAKLELDTTPAKASFDELVTKAKEWDQELITIEKAQEARWKQLAFNLPAAQAARRVPPHMDVGPLSDMIMMPQANAAVGVGDRLARVWTTIKERISSAAESLGNFVQRTGAAQSTLSAAALTAKQFTDIIDRGAASGADNVARLASLIVRLSESSGESFKSLTDSMVQTGAVSREEGAAILEMLGATSQEGSKLSQVFGNLGKVSKVVFGTILGVTAVRSLRRLIRWIVDATKESIAFEFAQVRMGVAIRAVQRQIGAAAGTMRSWQQTIQEMNTLLPNLSRVALTQAAGATLLLTRELGFNEEQMQRTLRAAATLSSIWGIDTVQALTVVTQGLTGIGRGLRRYGVFLSRVQLNQEALRIGIEKTWIEMNVQERAQVALNVVLRQTDPLLTDMNKLLETAAGRMAVFEARTQDATVELGDSFLPVMVSVKGALTTMVEGLGAAAKTLSITIVNISGATRFLITLAQGIALNLPLVDALAHAYEVFNAEIIRSAKLLNLLEIDLGDVLSESEQTVRRWEELFGEDFLEAFDETGDAMEELFRKGEEATADALFELEQDLIDMEEDLRQAYIDAFNDLQEELADLEVESQRERLEAYETYLEKLADLDIDYGRKRADIFEDEAYKLSQLDEDLSDAQAEAHRDYNQKLEQLERNHLRKMRQLRERFIEDMADVIARRDAWGAVKLIRRYNRERREAEQNLGDQRTDAAAALADRLDDLERSNDRRRKKIIADTKRRLRDLELWLKRQRAEIEESYAEDLEDLDIQLARKQQKLQDAYDEQNLDLQEAAKEQERERILAYQRELKNLGRSQDRKLLQLAAGLSAEQGLTREGARAVLLELLRVFGRGGDIDRLMDSFDKRMARRVNIEISVQRLLGTFEPFEIPGMQEGGTIIARKPTLVQFGEVPEMATFTPLSDISRVGAGLRDLGILRIEVNADRYFSQDFEQRVEDSISFFFENVVR